MGHQSRCEAVSLKVVTVGLGIAAFSPVVLAGGPLPQSGQFAAGSGVISSCGSQLSVTQSSTRGVIDWKSFSIGAGNTVNINNGSGATLSRVTGANVSVIDGNLSATGSLYLINPQGVVVGRQGVVTTGGRFVASTLDTINDAFIAGGPLTLAGTSNASVINLGKIGSSGSDVLLISLAHTENFGRIDAPNGTAELVTGKEVLLKDSASGQQVFVQPGAHGDVVSAGSVRAAQIHLEAADGNVYALAGRHDALRATGTAVRDGHVWLVARQGTVEQHERISARDRDGTGGTVETTGAALDVQRADVQAGSWNLSAPVLNVGSATAAALRRNLSRGTSVTLDASQGNIVVDHSLRWSGNASLTLNAVHSVTVGSSVTLANAGAGNLTLRADKNGLNNGGNVINLGTIDWSKSLGNVAFYRDRGAQQVNGQMVSNPLWVAAPYSGIGAQITSYVLVNTIDDLRAISQDLSGTYALGRDIDLNYDGSFQPIGIGNAQGFTGRFDGQHHTISKLDGFPSDLVEDKPAGLFAFIGKAGIVEHLHIGDVLVHSITGPVGALAGASSGLVADVHVSGRYVDSSGIVANGTGGLLGRNDGIVYRSDSSLSVSGQGFIGGLVGINTGAIVQSAAAGGAGGGSHGSVGGLVGNNSGTISASYSAVTVGNGNGVGGLVYSNSGTISESFASGQVYGFLLAPTDRGGLVARNGGTIATNVFWDRQLTGQASGVGSGAAVTAANGLTTAQMSKPESFGPTWDFSANGTWAILPGGTHPILRWQAQR